MKMKSALMLISCWCLLSWTSRPTFAEEGADGGADQEVTAENAEDLVNELSTTEELIDLICSCRENEKQDMKGEHYAERKPIDCYDIQQTGETKSGRYDIFPFEDSKETAPPVRVWCDMDTDGGGWTVFQRRADGSVDFYLDWASYKTGFGHVGGEHWLGNDNINLITNQRAYEFRVELEDWDGNKKFAKYDHFRVGDENTKYKLLLGDYSGDAGDSLSYHRNRAFSTADMDNDAWALNCASSRGGPWWYNVCEHSDLNGRYLKAAGAGHQGVTWHGFKGASYSLKFAEMKIRPTGI